MSDTENDNCQEEKNRQPFYENGWFWVSVFLIAVCIVGSIAGDLSPRKAESPTAESYSTSDISSSEAVSYKTALADDIALSEDESSETTTEPQWNGKTVYITPTGEKFHIKESCAGENAIETELGKLGEEYTACKRCAKQLSDQDK